MRRENELFKSWAIRPLIRLGKLSVEPLLAVAQNSKEDKTMRHECISALGQIKDQRAVKPLIKLFYSDNNLRTSIASALGNLGSQEAVTPLIAALKDSNYLFRANMARDLGKIGGSKAFEALTIFFSREEKSYVKMWTATALGESKDKRAFDFLQQNFYPETDVEIRSAIISALGPLGDRRAVPMLIQALKQEIAMRVRLRAAQALGELGGEEVIEPLIQALDDTDGTVRFYTVDVLGKLGDKRALPKLEWLKENDHFVEYEPGDVREMLVSEAAAFAIKFINEKQV
jgi:HEAT repeat protein